MAEERQYETWWIRDDEDRAVDESRAFVLQPMRGDEIASEIGPYVIQFKSPELRAAFEQGGGLDKLADYLDSGHEGVKFFPLTMRDLDEDEEY